MKFKRLQRRLKSGRKDTVGILELLWLATAKNSPQGDIGRFTNEEIAIECDWEGDHDQLVSALVECGWLDENDECRLVVHDWLNIHRDYRGSSKRRIDLSTSAWRLIRRTVIDQDGCECRYCGCHSDSENITVDHVIPVVRGGTMDRSNLVVACRSCNSRKGDR